MGSNRSAKQNEGTGSLAASFSVSSLFGGQGLTARLALLAELILVALIAFTLAKVFWLITAGATPPVLSLPEASSLSLTKTKSPRTDIVGTFDPFYRNNPQLAAAETAPEAEDELAPETTLNVQLYGTRYNISNARDLTNTAIIKDPRGQQASYQVGDIILEGVTLSAVYPTYVTISRSGVLERLSLDDQNSVTARRVTVARAPGNKRQSSPSMAPKNKNPRSLPAARTPTRAAPARVNQIDGNQLSEQDFQSLLNNLNLVPRLNGRQIEGWVMTPNGSSTLFLALGLQSGDVLKRVNGVNLKNAERLTEIFDDLEGASQVNLLIERNGQDQTVSFAYDG